MFISAHILLRETTKKRGALMGTLFKNRLDKYFIFKNH